MLLSIFPKALSLDVLFLMQREKKKIYILKQFKQLRVDHQLLDFKLFRSLSPKESFCFDILCASTALEISNQWSSYIWEISLGSVLQSTYYLSCQPCFSSWWCFFLLVKHFRLVFHLVFSTFYTSPLFPLSFSCYLVCISLVPQPAFAINLKTHLSLRGG